MKKIISTIVFSLVIFLVPFVLIGCSENKELLAYGSQRVFDINEAFDLGEDAQVKFIENGEERVLTSEEYIVENNIIEGQQGIYNVTITAPEEKVSYSYEIVVLDYSLLTCYYGDVLSDILLPNELNLQWKDPSESVGEIGENYKTAFFTTSEGQAIEINLPVSVRALSNSWTKELSIENWTYGQQPSKPIAEAEYGDIIFNYYKNDSGNLGEKLDGVPTQAGEYYVEASVINLEGYIQLTSVQAFTIEKASISVESSESSKITKTYDGSSFIDLSNFEIKDYLNLECSSTDISNLNFSFSDTSNFVDSGDLQTKTSAVGEHYLKVNINLPLEDFANFQFENKSFQTSVYIKGEILSQTPTIKTLPTASKITSGEMLSQSILAGGEVIATLANDENELVSQVIEGVWQWSNPEAIVNQNGTYEARFIPNDINLKPVSIALQVEAEFDDEANAYLVNENLDHIIDFTRENNNFTVVLPEDISYFMAIIEFSSNLEASYSLYFDDEIWEMDIPYWSGDALIEIDSMMMNLYSNMKIELSLTDGVTTRNLIFELSI